MLTVLEKMIVERKKARIIKPDEVDLASEFNFSGPGDWEDESVSKNEIIPWQIILAFAVITGLSAYAVGSYLF